MNDMQGYILKLVCSCEKCQAWIAKPLQCCLQMSCPFSGLMFRSWPITGMQTLSSYCSCCLKSCQVQRQTAP